MSRLTVSFPVCLHCGVLHPCYSAERGVVATPTAKKRRRLAVNDSDIPGKRGLRPRSRARHSIGMLLAQLRRKALTRNHATGLDDVVLANREQRCDATAWSS